MQVEHAILIRATPEQIFEIYEDVSHWHTWDANTGMAALEGPFEVGVRGSIAPKHGNAVPMLLTKVERYVSFTAESVIPRFCVAVEHEIVPHGEEVKVVHRAKLSGPLANLLGQRLVEQFNHGLPVSLGNLKRLAEGAA